MIYSLRILQWLCITAGLDLLVPSLAADTSAWKSRSIYQTMTDRFARTDGSTTHPCNTTEGLRCGGSWRGTIQHLDYIQGMGFDAIMISPIVQNVEGRVQYGEAYHGYWVQDMYALNPHFGTHQDLLDLSKAVHDRGMYLMVDTVINNLAYITDGRNPATSIDYSALRPFNDSMFFHPYCKITDYDNYPLAQTCWTGDDVVPLPDLKTEDSQVQSMLMDWIRKMMATYSIDGLRLDAAKHITPSFLPLFQNASGAFITGEVFEPSVKTICGYQKDLPSVPNYPIYYSILEAFTKGNTSSLTNQVEVMKQTCSDVTALTSFSENHDVARFASFKDDIALAKNVLTFTMLFDGIPMIYQGQEQHFSGASDPENREALWLSGYNTNAPLYQLATRLNRIRKHAAQIDPAFVDSQTFPIYTGSSEMGFRKGVEGRQLVMVLSTQGMDSGKYELDMPIGYQPGFVVTDVLNCANYSVNDMGLLKVSMDKGEPRVLFPADMMEGSGLCGYGRSNGTTYLNLKKNSTQFSGGGLSNRPTVPLLLICCLTCLILWC
ncbi:alpha-amylase [Aspergillus fumigatus Af293]